MKVEGVKLTARNKIKKSIFFHPSSLILHPCSRGFTLLEIMIALAITAIIVLTVISTVNYHAQLSYEHTLATRIFLFAKEKMAELKMNPQNGKGVSPDKDFSYESMVRNTNNNDIIELNTIVKGYGKEVALSELVFKKVEGRK